MSFRYSRLFLCVLLPAVVLSGCKTPEEAALGKRKKIFVAGKREANKKAEGGLAPGWNPAANIPRGGVGRQNSYSSVPVGNQPYLAMTFDDGPHPSNTPRLLDILKQRNIKATFYVVGTNARRYPEIMRRMIAEGHEIGNHTDNHGYLTKLSASAIRSDLARAHQAIVSATGVPPRTMRPPYGAITSDQKAWIKAEFGYPSIMWSVDPEDWKKPGVSVVTRRLVSGARPGGILLAHDIHAPTIEAIPSALDQLLAKGFRFVTVTQLIALEGRG
jgi:peptidoglycan/xylan/chitin deacetylase (PgdA/CDA1 family)